jgi:hypothetical protein
LSERCILWQTAGPPMLPSAYNNNQTARREKLPDAAETTIGTDSSCARSPGAVRSPLPESSTGSNRLRSRADGHTGSAAGTRLKTCEMLIDFFPTWVYTRTNIHTREVERCVIIHCWLFRTGWRQKVNRWCSIGSKPARWDWHLLLRSQRQQRSGMRPRDEAGGPP